VAQGRDGDGLHADPLHSEIAQGQVMAAMQDLVLNEKFMDDVEERRKLCTIRRGRRDIMPGALTFTSHINKDRQIYVNVTQVTYTTVADLTDEQARLDGASDANEMIASLTEFYPDLSDADTLTIIQFE
jgi:hypothetical protein